MFTCKATNTLSSVNSTETTRREELGFYKTLWTIVYKETGHEEEEGEGWFLPCCHSMSISPPKKLTSSSSSSSIFIWTKLCALGIKPPAAALKEKGAHLGEKLKGNIRAETIVTGLTSTSHGSAWAHLGLIKAEWWWAAGIWHSAAPTQWLQPHGRVWKSMPPLKHYLGIVWLSQHAASCTSLF